MNIEQKELLELGAVKSNYAVIRKLTEEIDKHLLNKNEQLSTNPASFTNIFLEEIGRNSAISFYEQMMYKNEMLPSTAIKLRSLMNKMSDEMAQSIYASPAMFNIVFGFTKEDLLRYAVVEQKNLEARDNKGDVKRRLTINKDIKFVLDDYPPFTIDCNINIIINTTSTSKIQQQKKQKTISVIEEEEEKEAVEYEPDPTIYEHNIDSIYAMFDVNEQLNKRSILYSTSNPILNTQYIRSEDGKEIFVMFIPARQYERTIIEFDITDQNPDRVCKFVDNLMGFEVAYMGKGDDDFYYKQGLADGNLNPSGYTFDLNIDDKTIGIHFNRTDDSAYWKPTIGGRIKIIIYTTKGSDGNFKVVDIMNNYTGLSFTWAQNRNDPFQEQLINLTPYLSLRDGISSGGSGMKTFEEIRKMVINWGSNNKIITPGEFERRGEKYNFTLNKIRDDIRCFEFIAKGILYGNNNQIIGSTTKDLLFDIKGNNAIKRNSEHYLFTPSDTFTLNNTIKKLEYKRGTTEGTTEGTPSNIGKFNNAYKFPFHIKFVTNDMVFINVFNMNQNIVYPLEFLYYNNATTIPTSIFNLNIYRNCIKDEQNVEFIIKEYFKKDLNLELDNLSGVVDFSCDIITDSNTIFNLEKSENNTSDAGILYYLEIINKTNNKRYQIEGRYNKIYDLSDYNIENNIIRIHFFLFSTDTFVDNNLLNVVNGIWTVPQKANDIDSQYLESDIDLKIYAIQRDPFFIREANEEESGDVLSKPYEPKLIKTDPGNKYKLDDLIVQNNTDNDSPNKSYDGWFISTVYRVENVPLFKDYTDYFKLMADLRIEEPIKETFKYSTTNASDFFDDEEKTLFDVLPSDKTKTEVEENNITIIKYETNKEDVLELIPNDDGSFVLDINKKPVFIRRYKKNSFKLRRPLAIVVKDDDKDAWDIWFDKKKKYFSDNTEYNTLVNRTRQYNLSHQDEPDITIDDYYEKYWWIDKCELKNTYTEPNPFWEDVRNYYEIARYDNTLRVKMDDNKENPIYHNLTDITYTGIIRNLPVYDSIYAEYNGYDEIVQSYERLISQCTNLSTLAPDGVETYIGIKNTSGNGDWEYYNPSMKIWKALEDISLSFDIGIKYDDTINEYDLLNESVNQYITEFIYTFDGISFSIESLFNFVKTKMVVIEYIVLYAINGFSSSDIQAIRKKDGARYVNDVLSVRQISGNTNSISSFQPDIKIRVL